MEVLAPSQIVAEPDTDAVGSALTVTVVADDAALAQPAIVAITV